MAAAIETTSRLPSGLSPTVTEKYYLNEEYADFHFLFKVNEDKDNDEYERVPAHKMALAESDVFRTMFSGDWKEKTEVVITDASVAVFQEFLQFFYLIDVQLTMENVGFVMNLGKKYNMAKCLAVCSKFLVNSITDDNVCTAYGLAILFDQASLRNYCGIIIGQNAETVLSSDDFFECDRKVLECILDLGYISCAETEVFAACMKWVKFKSGQDNLTREIVQEHLGDSFKKIRFKTISQQDFAMLLSSYGKLFSVDELVDINQLISLAGFKPNLFTKKERESFELFKLDGRLIRCNRKISEHESSEPYHIKEVEVTLFSVNEPVLLKTIYCSVFQYEDNVYDDIVELPTDIEIAQVTDQSNVKILCTQKGDIDSYSIIKLSKPVLIRPNHMYEIRFKQSPPINSVSGALLKSEVKIDSNITVKFHRDPKVEADWVARGLVVSLDFITI